MYNLITTITNLPMLVGCKEFPTDQQGMTLIKLIQDFINEEYNYNSQEVNSAFKMAIKRELYLDGKRIDPTTFGQYLSVNIVGQVLTAYKESKQGDKARPSGYNFRQLKEAEPKKISPQDAHELILKWIRNDGIMPAVAPYIQAYEYLVEKKCIKPVEEEKKRGRSAQVFGATIEMSPKRQAAENWYRNNR